MYFGPAHRAIRKPNPSESLELPPTPWPIHPSQSLQLPNAAAHGDDLDLRDVAEKLDVHDVIMPRLLPAFSGNLTPQFRRGPSEARTVAWNCLLGSSALTHFRCSVTVTSESSGPSST